MQGSLRIWVSCSIRITLSKFKVYLCNFYKIKHILSVNWGGSACIFVTSFFSEITQGVFIKFDYLYYSRENYILIQYIGKLWRTLSHEADVELKDHHTKFYFSTNNQKYRQDHICSITRVFVSVNLEIRLGKAQLYWNSVRNFEIVCAVNEHVRPTLRGN
jgi:hypothetical protein